MLNTFQEFANFFVLLAGVLALVRFKMINRRYYPFLYFIWLGCLAEIFGEVAAQLSNSNAAVYNVYVLCEACLILWFFKSVGLLAKPVNDLLVTIGMVSIAWLIELYLRQSFSVRFTYYRVFYAFIIVLYSIQLLSKVLVADYKGILTEPLFIISSAFILYFTYKILIEAMAIYGFRRSNDFLLAIYDVMTYINFTTNILYTFSIIWITRRTRFTLQY